MRNKFKYTKLRATPTDGFPQPYVYQPLLPVILVNPKTNKQLRYIALLDSGADFCLFHGLVGELIGFDVRSGNQHQFGGVSSRGHLSFVHQLEIQPVGLPRVKTPVAFSYEIEDPYKGIVGQRGFFEYFKITFNYKQRSFSLKLT